MSYIEFEKTNDPEIIKLQIELVETIYKEDKLATRIGFIVLMVICAVFFVFGIWWAYILLFV